MNEPDDNPGGPISDAQLDELLGAYALDAVEADEHRQVDAYLRRNDDARREISRFEDVLAALATAEASDPPPELWTRVSEQLRPPRPLTRSDDEADDGPGVDSPSAAAPVIDLTVQRAARRGRWRNAVLAAAAVVALVVASVAVATRPDGSPGTLTELALAAERADGSSAATLQGEGGTARLVIDAEGNGYLMAEDLPRLAADETYQLWSLDGATPVSLGVIGGRPTTVAVPAGAVRTVALSVEPTGGNASPTLPPVAVGEVEPA